MHENAIASFAVSRDGQWLATGSDCGPEGDFVSPAVGVVLWDLASGEPRASVAVEGGIGLCDVDGHKLAAADRVHHSIAKRQHPIGTRGGRPERVLPLLEGWREGLDGYFTLTPSPSGRMIAASSEDPRCGRPAIVGTSLINADTGARVFASSSLTHVSAFVFDQSETRWATVSASRNVRPPPHVVHMFSSDSHVGEIRGPFAPIDWQQFADGVPFVFSPDGKAALVVRPDGEIERFSADGSPAGRLARVEGASGLLWPRPDLVVAAGTTVVAFVRVPSGEVSVRFRR
jgi:hypothetical protein